MKVWRRSLAMKSKTGLLSMCARAGKLSMGMDMMKDACKNGNAKAVFTADDISEKSLKEDRYFCARYGVKCYALGLTMDDLATGLGKRTGILAVTDAGFAKAGAKGLEEIVTDIDEFEI